MLPPKYWLVQNLDIRQDSVPLYTLITLILRQCFVTSCPYKECNLASSTALSSSLKYQGDGGGGGGGGVEVTKRTTARPCGIWGGRLFINLKL